MDRICIDGFPRSGNTFSGALLTNAFPQAHITPFTHSARVLSSEHFVLIRDPDVSISSFMSVFNEPNKSSSELWWLRFYNTMLDKTSPDRWIFFDDLINETNKTITRIGEIIKLKPLEINYAKLNKNSTPKPYLIHSFGKAQELYKNLKRLKAQSLKIMLKNKRNTMVSQSTK
jgi:hypothetical protein